mmetsp:Transcript_29880/g.41342  ORF Transcript_29880/g.41342 Transcript_29880/m.41342 type:complete len:576 (+) Transcript_29880:122-1849(+)|eukprot:CAMPEP_0196594188 /NCGR_PEP_ID=MMETSP1081-20130531/77612_1 /TAXON_ID=36882 /ORGANISM="Pyramimonas amylifera, Strain CCMP720" /LENGTH=575 /DNA_ID=CAMNT_0041918385 /DNA_START=114 /DNA_END=1841 /DNA_ORIENTATION=-
MAPAQFPNIDNSEAGRWCPDGSGQGHHIPFGSFRQVTQKAETSSTSESSGELSKAQLKKLKAKEEKEAFKAAKVAAREQAEQSKSEVDENDPLKDNYGDLPLVQSQCISGRVWTRVDALGTNLIGSSVLVRARVHTVRSKGKSAFLVLRQQTSTVQAVLFVNETTVSKSMVKYVAGLSRESIMDVQAMVRAPEAPVDGCTQKLIELEVVKVHCVSKAEPRLPFTLEDASRSEKDFENGGEGFARVGQDTRLDNRALDLRTPANNAIFRLQSSVCFLFRSALLAQGFTEIHTPKLIGGTSEGGSAVFRFEYMNLGPGCLAQSPQLYKQMAICSDLERVFEIGPVFRAEDSHTHRHLCEFTGLDMEMQINEHYFEVLDVLDKLFLEIFDGLSKDPVNAKLVSTVHEQYPAEPFEYKSPSLRLTFEEGIAMLHSVGVMVDALDDLSTETERVLGKLVKDKYKTDFYMLHRYPSGIRPFYTMPCHDDSRYSNSFDIFMRGEEIISGAQRVHDPKMLAEAAKLKEIDVETIQSYIDSFKLGASPHGGCGVGLERVVMLFLGLNNIRKTSMFPRDPKRLSP